MASNSKEEPKTGPQPNRWYNLTLGPSFKDDSANKYCTLRYEFKPASIDKTKPGALKKTKDNRVAVEFQNNQLGKPNVTFKGSSEEYKDNDAVLFFDGQTFRLERLHRAVKQLRHDRQPGESAAGMAVDPQLSPVGKAPKLSHQYHPGKTAFPAVPVEVERIDVGVSENPGAKTANKGVVDYPSDQPNVPASPGPKNEEVDDEHQDIDIEDLFGSISPDDGNAAEDEANAGFDINMLHQNESDNEIADVDDSGDEVDKGPNAAEALRAQVMNTQGRETHTDTFGDEGNAEGRKTETSSSSSSSGSSSGSESSSSGSSSGSSSSSGSGNGGGNNAGSDDDSVNSI